MRIMVVLLFSFIIGGLDVIEDAQKVSNKRIIPFAKYMINLGAIGMIVGSQMF